VPVTIIMPLVDKGMSCEWLVGRSWLMNHGSVDPCARDCAGEVMANGAEWHDGGEVVDSIPATDGGAVGISRCMSVARHVPLSAK
jgi:hypothetical protein